MHRERPEYLPPIKPRRWGFPWMLAIGATTVTLAGFGLKQHLATQAAWDARFNRTAAPTSQTKPLPPSPEQLQAEMARVEVIKRIREQRELAERQVQRNKQGWRCINGTPFRKIPGGWENVVGERC